MSNSEKQDFYRPQVKVPDYLVPKWSEVVLKEGFVPFPKKILRCLDKIFTGDDQLSQLRVVLAIADFKRPDQYRSPSIDFLSFVAGMEQKRFVQIIASLQTQGLIIVLKDDKDEFEADLTPLCSKVEALTSVE